MSTLLSNPKKLVVDSSITPDSIDVTSGASNSNSDQEQDNDEPVTAHWITLKKVSSVVFNSSFKLKYGKISTFTLLADFMVFGTKKGYAVIFDYNQNIKGVLGEDDKKVLSSGSVTSLAISLDSTYIATGHEYGHIFLWDVTHISNSKTIAPLIIVEPLTINDKLNGKEGHLLNKSINHLFFLNRRHTGFVSVDVDGLVLFHNGYRSIFGYNYRSLKILGLSDLDFTFNQTNNHNVNIKTNSNYSTIDNKKIGYLDKKFKSYVFGCSPLPLCQDKSKIDNLNLLAIITSSALLVISITPKLTTHVKLGKPKLVSSNSNARLTTCLSWYPELSTKLPNGSRRKTGARLAYCFSNVLTVLELDTVQELKDLEQSIEEGSNEDLEQINVVIVSKKRWVCDESILSVMWFNTKILLVLTISSKILVIDSGLIKFKLNSAKELRLITSIDAISNHASYNNYMKNLIPISEVSTSEININNRLSLFNTYDYTMKTFKRNIFLLTENSKIIMGFLINWEKCLVELVSKSKKINNEQYLVKALRECLGFYTGECDLVRYSLPDDDMTRKQLIQSHLIDLIFLNLRTWFQADSMLKLHEDTLDNVNSFFDNEDPQADSRDDEIQLETFSEDPKVRRIAGLQNLLVIVFEACVSMRSSRDIYEEVFEFFEDTSYLKSIFFKVLGNFIFSKQINELTPKILKELIIFYSTGINNNHDWSDVDRLEQMICLLNVKDMDLDLIISLCNKYSLIDSKIFIWNSLLRDYTGPLMDFMNLIKKVLYNSDYYTDLQLQNLKTQAFKTYTYLSYVLTDRQYPLEKLILGGEAEIRKVKTSIYSILFSGSSLEWPPNSGEVFFVTDNPINEPSFPYLYLLFRYDTEKALLMLNEVFEDDFLNEEAIAAPAAYVTNDHGNSLKTDDTGDFKISRQYIIEILFDVFRENRDISDLRNQIYLSIFILRNYPKYSQFIRLNDLSLDNLIEKVCNVNQLDEVEQNIAALRNDCELSLQSLLSTYRPTNLNDELIYYFEKSKFYNLLFNLYRVERKSSRLFQLWINEKSSLTEKFNNFEIIQLCFGLVVKDNNLSELQKLTKQIELNFKVLVLEGNLKDLIKVLIKYNHQFNKKIYSLNDEKLQFEYLSALFEIVFGDSKSIQNDLVVDEEDIIAYVSLLCRFNTVEAVNFLKKTNPSFFSPAINEKFISLFKYHKIIEGLIYITFEIENNYSKTLDEVTSYLGSRVLSELETKEDVQSTFNAKDLEKNLWRYLSVAVNACRIVTSKNSNEGETLWIKLNSSVNQLIRKVEKTPVSPPKLKDRESIIYLLKRILQDIFISLINTNFQNDSNTNTVYNDAFLRIFNQFLDNTSSDDKASTTPTTLSDVKEIINDIFFLNVYQQESLKVTLNLYNREVLKHLQAIEIENAKGITMNGIGCTGCGKRIWGRKISTKIFQNWEDFKRKKLEYLIQNGKKVNSSDYVGNFEYKDDLWKELKVVIFKCGHGYHLQCIENLGGKEGDLLCVVCHAKEEE